MAVYSKYTFCAERAHVLTVFVAQTLIFAAIDGHILKKYDSPELLHLSKIILPPHKILSLLHLSKIILPPLAQVV